MSVAGKNVQFVDAVVLGVHSPTVELNNLPTLVVSRSTAEPVQKNISFAGNIQVVNFIAGVFAILQSATLAKNGFYLFVNTCPANIPMSLDSGGTVGGLATYILQPGQAIKFLFDGTNLG
jgi:hypothetical protein